MNVLEYLKNNFLYFDGGFGTLLYERGLPAGVAPERWNITNPDDVTAIHKSYFDAGSNVATTNTFGASILKFDENELDDIVRNAVMNADRARNLTDNSEPKFIALDIGPTGKMLKPFGDLEFEEAYEIYAEQACAAEAAGADIIIVETMAERKRLGSAVLRFGSTPMAGAGFTQDLFRALETGRSPLSVNLVEGGRPRLLQLLDDGLIDFAFVATRELPPDKYACIDLRDSEIVFCVHPSSPLAQLEAIDSAAQIGGEPLAFFSDEFYLAGLLHDFFKKEGLAPNIIARAAQIFTVIQFVRSGTASAFLNRDAAAEFADIVAIPLREPISLKLGFVWKKDARAAELEPVIRSLASQLGGVS